MQSLLRRNSLSSDPVANTSDPSSVRDQEGTQREDRSQDQSYRKGQLREKKEGENQAMKDKSGRLNMEERESSVNRSMSEQLQQTRSRSTSPARSTAFFSVLSFHYYFYTQWKLHSHFKNLILTHTVHNVVPPTLACPHSVLITDWTPWCSRRPGSCHNWGSRSRRAAGWEPCSVGSWRSWEKPSRSCCKLAKSTTTWGRWSKSS